MADFSALKTSIQNYIKQNGNEEITGNLLQQILLSMVTTLGDSAINDLVTALNAEIANRGNADTTLQGNINSEAAARANADTELGGRITTLQGVVNGIKANVENGYVYAGIATQSTTPVSGKVFYLALTAGTYTNFGATEVPQGINILKYNGSAWSLDSFLGLDDAPTQGSSNLVKSGGVLDSIIKDGSAFDLSAYNSGTTYADLSAALTALNALPAAYKKGGMSMKYVQTSDNKYVQARCMSQTFTTDVTQWQVVDNAPADSSKNLVESGGVYDQITMTVAENSEGPYSATSSGWVTIGPFHTGLVKGHKYHIKVTVDATLEYNTDLVFMVDNTALDTVAAIFPSTETTFEFDYIPTVDNINKLQARNTHGHTWSVKVMWDTKETLKNVVSGLIEDCADLEDEIKDVEELTEITESNSFESGPYTKSGISRWVVVGPFAFSLKVGQKYHFLIQTNTAPVSNVSIYSMAGNTAGSEISVFPSGQTSHEFDYTPSVSGINKLQMRNTETLTWSAMITWTETKISYVNEEVVKIKEYYQYHNTIRCFAHQGYDTIGNYYGNNRVSSYVGAAKNGFTDGETDIIFSSDNVPFCSHDSSFVDSTTGEVVVIAEHTAAELKTYNYFKEKIATLEEVVATCKEYGLGLELDHVSNVTTQERANTIFGIIKKYNMEDKIVWTAGGVLTIAAILAWHPKATIMVVSNDTITDAVIERVNSFQTLNNTVMFVANYKNNTPQQIISASQKLNAGIKIGIYTCDDIEVLEDYLPYISFVTSNKLSEPIIDGVI